jgi:hypothetical protein
LKRVGGSILEGCVGVGDTGLSRCW